MGFLPTPVFPFDLDDVGVVGDAVDEGDCAGGVRKDGCPVLGGQVGGQGDQFTGLLSASHDLEEDVGNATVVGEIP